MFLTAGCIPIPLASQFDAPSARVLDVDGRLAAAVLDEVDYGTVVVTPTMRVQCLNHAARVELAGGTLLRWTGDRLQTAMEDDERGLCAAVCLAATRGVRGRVTLAGDRRLLALSVIPIGGFWHDGETPVLLLMGRRELCTQLSRERFAREHGLTRAESAVLSMLAEGQDPTRIAVTNGVGLATVRSQIQNIRTKTGAPRIRDLLMRLARLPPMVGTLGRSVGAGAEPRQVRVHEPGRRS
jgi:DNA-binding CsgD family transcriptional regulator